MRSRPKGLLAPCKQNRAFRPARGKRVRSSLRPVCWVAWAPGAIDLWSPWKNPQTGGGPCPNGYGCEFDVPGRVLADASRMVSNELDPEKMSELPDGWRYVHHVEAMDGTIQTPNSGASRSRLATRCRATCLKPILIVCNGRCHERRGQ